MIRGKGKQKKEYDRRRNADEKRKQEKAENRRKKMDGPTTLCSGKRGTRNQKWTEWYRRTGDRRWTTRPSETQCPGTEAQGPGPEDGPARPNPTLA